MRGEILEDFSPSTLTAAIEANVNGQYPLLFAHLWQVEVHDDPDMLWVVSDIPDAYLNCVLRAQLEPDEVDTRIEATLAHYNSRHLPLAWRVGPSTRPADLGEHLTAHGLSHTVDTTGMAVDLQVLNDDLTAPPRLKIEEVGDLETLWEWVRPVAIGFDQPPPVANALFEVHALTGFGEDLPWRLYLGRLNGEPVAASRLFLAGGVAGVFAVATIPEARGRGIGTAMTLGALSEARGMGYRIGVLHSDPEALEIYRRLGFKEHCRFGFYMWGGEGKLGQGTASN